MGAEFSKLSHIEVNLLKELMLLSEALPPLKVKDKLWEVFRLAVNGGLEDAGATSVTPIQVADLFDRLVYLVSYLEKLNLLEDAK